MKTIGLVGYGCLTAGFVLLTLGCNKVESTQPVSTATAPERRLSPAGVFFLTERISTPTDAGVTAFPPGTRVKMIKENGPVAHVRTDDNQEFDIARSHLTNDLDAAAKVIKSDASSQAQTTRRMAAERKAVQLQEQARLARQTAEAQASRQKRAPAVPQEQ